MALWHQNTTIQDSAETPWLLTSGPLLQALVMHILNSDWFRVHVIRLLFRILKIQGRRLLKTRVDRLEPGYWPQST